MPQVLSNRAIATSLRAVSVRRETFDPTNSEHVESFRRFIETGTWGEVKFHVEVPFTEVPATVMMKFAAHALKVPMAVRLVKGSATPVAKPVLTGIVSPIADLSASLMGTIIAKAA